jgi:hypothetical protein
VTTQTAISTSSFVNSLGVNTHIDFADYGYQNLAIVESAIKYLGLTNLRDSAETASDATTWQQVAQATGAKFDDYIAETSPAGMTTDLGFAKQLASEGILNYLEGGNEEDDAYPASLGNTLQITAQFQQQVYATGHALGLPVINMSFGSGWTAANNWQGDYGAVGGLSAYADYANAHTYSNVGQGTDWTIQRINGLAELAAASRPVITTEIGWDENQGFAQTDIAKFALDATMDGIKDGDVKTYFYALFDDSSGNFGLMNADGTAKPAGMAIHDLTTLLADTGATASTFTPGSLSYTLTGTTANDNTLVMEKSDGSYWLSVWNESDASHNVTLTLGGATEIKVFDPLTGTAALQDVKNVASATFTVADHPILVEVLGASGSAPPPPPAPPSPTPDDLTIAAPASETVAAGSEVAVSGASISDPWAAAAPGSVTLNVWDSAGGTIAMAGQTADSSGWISVSGTLAQLNLDLAGLSYTAGRSQGGDTITLDVWNQAGVEVQQVISLTVTPAATPNILFQNTNGSPAIWAMSGTTLASSVSLPDPGPTWHISGTGVFHTGGTADILWQNDDGTPAIWVMNGTSLASSVSLVNPSNVWHIRGSADFAGTGQSDILWQNDNGAPDIWMMNGTSLVSSLAMPDPGPTWHIMATGVFHAGGTADILWQNDSGTPDIWVMNGTSLVSSVALPDPGPTWHIEATGDFSGTGQSDILWQNDNGASAIWVMNGTSLVSSVVLPDPGPTWHIKSTGDFNGDGRPDILWQNNDGSTAIWSMNGTTETSSSALPDPGPSWQVTDTQSMNFIYGAVTSAAPLAGTALADEFVLTAYTAGEHDISGFNPFNDVVELSRSQFTSPDDALMHVTAFGGGSQIELAGFANTSLVLENVAPGQLHDANFVIV